MAPTLHGEHSSFSFLVCNLRQYFPLSIHFCMFFGHMVFNHVESDRLVAVQHYAWDLSERALFFMAHHSFKIPREVTLIPMKLARDWEIEVVSHSLKS